MAKSTASLRVFGDELDPDTVTRTLGHEPSQSYRRGDFISPGRRPEQRKCGMWLLAATDAEPEAFEEQIEALLLKLTDDLTVWRKLTEHYQVDLYCGFFMDTSNQGFSLPARSMSLLTARGIEIGFEVYAPSPEEEAEYWAAQEVKVVGGAR